MPKPIFVVQIAFQGDLIGAYEKFAKSLNENLTDYHVICMMDHRLAENKFQVFSGTEINPIEIQDLKDLVLKSFKSGE
jgi:hypothetical protein